MTIADDFVFGRQPLPGFCRISHSGLWSPLEL